MEKNEGGEKIGLYLVKYHNVPIFGHPACLKLNKKTCYVLKEPWERCRILDFTYLSVTGGCIARLSQEQKTTCHCQYNSISCTT